MQGITDQLQYMFRHTNLTCTTGYELFIFINWAIKGGVFLANSA